MSWSVNKIGKAKAVAAALAVEFAKMNLPSPEIEVKNEIAGALSCALACYSDDIVVSVAAGGSQSAVYGPDGKPTGAVTTVFSAKLETLYGFVE